MANFGRVKTWGSEVLQPSDLNAEFDNIVNNVTSNTVDADNIKLDDDYAWTGTNTWSADAKVLNGAGLLIGATAQVTTSSVGELQLLGTAAADSTGVIGRWSADASGPTLSFLKSRHGTIGSNTIVADNDVLGTIEFHAADGSDFATPGASIFARVNGTPGANDLPTELVFATTADGGNSVTENLKIEQDGKATFTGAVAVGGTLASTGAATLASLVCTAAATFGGGTGSSGATISTAGAGTFDGILKTEDTTAATSTTDGSLQTDGGLSVALDAIIGDDLKLLSDSAVLSLGAGSDATLTHDGTTGVTIAANPIIVDSGDDLTLDAHTGILIIKDAGSEVLRFTEGSSGQVTVKLATDGKNLVFTDNGDATNMTILDAAAGINVPGEVQTTGIGYTDGDNAITIADGGVARFLNKVFINDTANGNMTLGLSIDQAANDDEILAFKSTGDVSHSFTGETGATTYGAFSKHSNTLGGLHIMGFAESNQAPLVLHGAAVTAQSTHASNGGGAVRVYASDNDSGLADLSGGENCFSVHKGDDRGGDNLSVFLVDAAGNYWFDGAAQTAFDDYQDAELVRAVSVATSSADVIRSRWDEHIRYNEQDLIDANILGGPVNVPEGEPRGLVNGAQLSRLHNGAIWQLHTQNLELKEELDELKERLKLLEA